MEQIKSIPIEIQWPNGSQDEFRVDGLFINNPLDELFIIGYDHHMDRFTALGLLERGDPDNPDLYVYAVKQLEDQDKYLEMVSSLIGDYGMYLLSRFGAGWESEEIKRIKIPKRLEFWLQDKPIKVIYKIGQDRYFPENYLDSYPHEPELITDVRLPEYE